MKKVLSFCLILSLIIGILCIFPVNAEELPEGQISGDYWYTVLEDDTAKITKYIGNESVVNIPSEIEGYKVTSIGSYAFSNSTATEIFIPDTVTILKVSAFRLMRKLETIHIPDSVKTIESTAFEHCKALSSITFPQNLEKMGIGVLDYTPYYDNPDNWENDVLYAGSYVISAKESISGVCEIKEGTRLIADNVFSLRSEVDEFRLPQSLQYIGELCFASCRSLEYINIPEGVVAISEGAFMGCSALESITLPENIRIIGRDILTNTAYFNNISNWQGKALYLGNALLDVKTDLDGEYKVKDGTRIVADYAVSECNITSLILPDSVEYIGEGAFSDCYELENVRFSEKLGKISKRAFTNCLSLNDITIPDSVTEINYKAFVGCRSLLRVMVPETVKEIAPRALGYENTTYPAVLDSFTIYGIKGSAAEEYALKNEIPFAQAKATYKETVLGLLNMSESSYYSEEYEYFATSDEATPEFVLIYAYDSWYAHPYMQYFGNYILFKTNARNSNKGSGYYIYLPEDNQIYPLEEAYDNKTEGIYDFFRNNIIGELIGDTNNDNRLSIQDATNIQKTLVGLYSIAYNFKPENYTDLVADFNKDGIINIRDATAIQKHLAGIAG